MDSISVIICTHNPKPDYLRRVLDSLDAQTLSKEEWELILVDNASETPLVGNWKISWHPQAKHIREDELGLTPARLRGIEESSGDILVYVDDDNVLAPDYLEAVRSLLMEHPHLGVIGAGIVDPEFAVQPPSELIPYLGYLALRRVPKDHWSTNTNDLDCLPWGCGLCVKREVANSYRQLVNSFSLTELLDRRGGHLFGDGDAAFSWACVTERQGFGVFRALKVIHLISAERLTQRYFVRLAYDGSFSSAVLHYRRAGIFPGSEYGFGERWVRLFLHGIRRGLFAMRFKRAVWLGSDDARQLIQQRRLLPLDQSDCCAATYGSTQREIYQWP